MPVPQIDDEEAWRKIISAKRWRNIATEDLVQLIQNERANGSTRTVNAITERILTVALHQLHRTIGRRIAVLRQDAIDLAMDHIIDDLLNPEGKPGRRLARAFGAGVRYRGLDGAREAFRYAGRLLPEAVLRLLAGFKIQDVAESYNKTPKTISSWMTAFKAATLEDEGKAGEDTE